MNSHHELAMLSAQMWGEANAESAQPEHFGACVADAYTSAFTGMECGHEFAEAIAYGVAIPPEGPISNETLMNILTKRAK